MKSIAIISALIICFCGAIVCAGDGSATIYHDTMDAWNSSRHFDSNDGTVTVGDGCMEIYPLSTTDIFRFHTDVNDVVVHKGDILMFDYQVIGWGATRSFVMTDMLLIIDNSNYGYNPGETWVYNNAYRDTTLTMHTVKWEIPVTGVLKRADFRLEWGQETSVRICDVKIIRPCTNDTELWHDDLENASSPPRFYSDCTLMNDGAGFITFRSDSNQTANFATSVSPESNGINVSKGDIFETEFKCEGFAGKTGAVLGIAYIVDSNAYYTPGLGLESTYTDTNKHIMAYQIPVSGRLTGVYFRVGFCDGGTFTVYDYKIHRISPCTDIAGDIEGGSGLFYVDVDGFVHFTNDYDVDFQDFRVLASNWLDTNGGITLNTGDSATGPGYGEISGVSSADVEVRPGGPWGNYLYATSWGNLNWTVQWSPYYMSYTEDQGPGGSLGIKSGIDVMAGDVLTVDVNGPIQDFQTTVVVRKYPSSVGGNDSTEFYCWLKDPNREYHDGYWTTIGQWEPVRLVIPATGKLIRAEFSVYSDAQPMCLDNIKLTRNVLVERYHDDLQDANVVSGKRTYTNLTYVDGDGFVQIVPTTTGGTTATSGRFITDLSANEVDVYPGDILEFAFNIAAMPAGGTTNMKVLVTIDGFAYSTANPMYGTTGPQTLRLIVDKPEGWIGAPLKMTKVEFRTSYATLGTKVNVEDYRLVLLPLQVTLGDINSDKLVNLKDVALMAQNWVLCTRPDCN